MPEARWDGGKLVVAARDPASLLTRKRRKSLFYIPSRRSPKPGRSAIPAATQPGRNGRGRAGRGESVV